ncbi:hypothetical protein G6F57_019559 [Rhizopus arrhizus]|nr:hypothetical protein G6F57_019559 [Rhizopus arrhizus]
MYLALRLFWKLPKPTLRQWRNLVIMGVTMLVLGNGMVVLAEREVSSGLAATAVASVPLWMALFSALRGQHASRGEWLGIAIGFLGVVWLNAGSSLTASPTGLVLLLIAPVGWAFDDLRRRAAGADRPGGGRAPDHLARHQRPAGDGLPVRVRFHRRVHRLRMAAAERAPGARRQLCVRQSGDRGAAGRAAQR